MIPWWCGHNGENTSVAQNGDSIERLLFYALLARAAERGRERERRGEREGRGRRRRQWLMTVGHVYSTEAEGGGGVSPSP